MTVDLAQARFGSIRGEHALFRSIRRGLPR